MNKDRIRFFIGKGSMGIVDAMKMINENAHGILFIVDENDMLTGSITDGDIRRWLIHTGDLEACVFSIMNANPRFLYLQERSRAAEYMKENHLNALPLLDAQNRIMDIAFALEVENEENARGNDLNEVSVVIMAGGKGTRLYPYTKILPKPLIPVGDIPIIERIIAFFCDYGVSNYYITVNYKKNMIKSYFSDLTPDYSVQFVEEESPLGTGGSLKLIQEKFQCPFIVTNCDTLIQADYSEIYQQHIQSGNAMTIVSALKNIEVPYGVLHTSENGHIVSIEEKPKLSYLINTGMYILDPEVIDIIPDSTVYHMTDLAEELMRRGMSVGMYPISDESFLDMGEFEEMYRMENKLKK